MGELRHYQEVEEIFGEEEEKWCRRVIAHQVPVTWTSKTILTIENWL